MNVSCKIVSTVLWELHENYFRILEDKDIYTLCKFRITNHKLPIETGQWNNIDRVNRICTTCDNITIGDEYHYIMECEHFSNFRNRFIVTNLRERPNILKCLSHRKPCKFVT